MPEQAYSEAPETQNSADVLIVGAGPAGLAVGGCLRRAGVSVLLLEASAAPGDSWRRHYDRLHLHTAKRLSALPYFPFPSDYPLFPGRQQVVDYLTAYAAHFGLSPRLNQRAESVRPVEGGWQTRTADTVYQSRCVVIATGTNQVPNRPDFPGLERYKGTVLHSSEYRNGERFRGQKTLVIGFGNSGTEIALDLYEHGSAPTMAVRGAVNVVSRDVLPMIPSQYFSWLLRGLPTRMVDLINAPIVRIKYGDLSRYHLKKLPYGAVDQMRHRARIPVIDMGVMKLIKSGQIKVRPGVESFSEDGVSFADGQHEAFDAVILATGYRVALGGLLPPDYTLLDDHGVPLHSGQPSAAPGLYFCGFTISSVGMLYAIAREAKRIAADITLRLAVHAS